jgi:hypothetical protein
MRSIAAIAILKQSIWLDQVRGLNGFVGEPPSPTGLGPAGHLLPKLRFVSLAVKPVLTQWVGMLPETLGIGLFFFVGLICAIFVGEAYAIQDL